jgi:hypothetical protein
MQVGGNREEHACHADSLPVGHEPCSPQARQEQSCMGFFLSVVGLTLIAVGLVGSAVTMSRESSR